MKKKASVIIQTAFRVFQCAIVNTVLADATAATPNNNGKVTKDEGNNNGKESLSENVNPSKDKDNDNKKVVKGNEDTDSPIRPTDNNGSYSQHFNPVPIENQQSEKNTTIKPSSVQELSK